MQTTAKKCNHGANIRRWREWRNVNQDVLAEEIGVSQATLSGYEKKETLEQVVQGKGHPRAVGKKQDGGF